jgi:hypothetical protein
MTTIEQIHGYEETARMTGGKEKSAPPHDLRDTTSAQIEQE